MSLDANQIIKKCFDSTKNALRISGVAGSLDGQITWDTGLGAITHILGPSDQGLVISAQGLQTLALDLDENVVIGLQATGAYVASGNAETWNLNAIAAGGDVTLLVSVDGAAAQTITFTSTDFANYAAATAAEAEAVIDAAAVGFHATDVAGTLVLTHDSIGQTTTIRVTGGTANNAINGFNFATTTQYGSGDCFVYAQLVFGDGMGPLAQIQGPSDEDLYIDSGTGMDAYLRSGGGIGTVVLSTTGGTVTLAAAGGLTSSSSFTATTDFLFTGAAGHAVTGVSNQNLTVSTSGSGHTIVQAAGGSLTITDDAGIDLTSTANQALDLNTSGTGHVIVSTANNTLTLNDDAGTGITTNGRFQVGGALVSDAARVIETLVMQAGAAHVITVAATDHFIGVDCSAAGKAVNLPAAATAGTGRVLIIKDQSGNAGANNITVTPNGAEKIDEAATHVINSNYGSVTLVCTGTAGNEWAVV